MSRVRSLYPNVVTPAAVHLTAAPADDDIRVTWESTDNLAGVASR